VYFKPSKKNQDFLFLPLSSKPASMQNDHLIELESIPMTSLWPRSVEFLHYFIFIRLIIESANQENPPQINKCSCSAISRYLVCSQVAAGSNQLFTGSIDGVDNIFSEKL
jgi:hypothetical protein